MKAFLAVDRVSFTLLNGKHLAIIGPSGCGKTTLLKAITGLVPYEGKILRPDGPLGYMPQKGVLLPWFSVLKTSKFHFSLEDFPKKLQKKKSIHCLSQFRNKRF